VISGTGLRLGRWCPRTSRLIIVKENSYQSGWGGTIASVVADEGFEFRTP
jgi:pyruvate/2-oxoglutarate/acetoin dehydrogenase E1 component